MSARAARLVFNARQGPPHVGVFSPDAGDAATLGQKLAQNTSVAPESGAGHPAQNRQRGDDVVRGDGAVEGGLRELHQELLGLGGVVEEQAVEIVDWLGAALVLAKVEQGQVLDVAPAPIALKRSIAAFGNGCGEPFGLAQGIGDAVADRGVLVMAGVADEDPSGAGGTTEEVAALDETTDVSVRLSVCNEGGDDRVRPEIGEEAVAVVRAPCVRDVNRGAEAMRSWLWSVWKIKRKSVPVCPA